jgi:hypothetical protein
VGGSRECGEGFEVPRYDRPLVSGQLDNFGLTLRIHLQVEQHGTELTEQFAIPWSTLILRRSNIMRHRRDFLGV